MIGRHLSLSHIDRTMARLGIECAQVFVKSPRTLFSTAANKQRTTARLVAHAGYLINLCHGAGSDSANSLLHEAKLCEQLGIRDLVVHCGSGDLAEALRAINTMGALWPRNVRLLLENSAGQGKYLCSDPDELRFMARQLQIPVGICWDTAHGWAAGVPMEFWPTDADVYHVNDSAFPFGMRKDRHANLGLGHIPLLGLVTFLRKVPRHVPLICETPDGPGAERDLQMLKEALYG